MSMLTLIFLIPAHGAKAANGPAEGEGSYAYIGFADYENEIKYVYCAPHVGTAESVAGASYDKASNTLTLNEYSGTTFRIVTNMMGDDFKIRLIGKNHVQQLAVWGDGWGGCVEFVGDGSLYVNEKKLFMDAVILMPEYSKACIKTSGNAVLYCYAPNGGRPLRVSAAMTNRADEVVVGKGALSVDIEDAYHAAEKQVSVITQFSDFKTTYAVYKKEGSEKKYAVSTGTLNDKEAYFISEILECDGLETSPFIYEIKSVSNNRDMVHLTLQKKVSRRRPRQRRYMMSGSGDRKVYIRNVLPENHVSLQQHRKMAKRSIRSIICRHHLK